MSADGVPGTSGSVWLVGCGNMGGAMLRRWVDGGLLSAGELTVIDPDPAELPAGVRHVADVRDAGDAPDILVLAVKPQSLDTVAATLPVPGMLVSILAGVEVAALAARIAAPVIVRAMPNLPVQLGKGVVALHTATNDTAAHDAAAALMAPLGLVEWIAHEAAFDAVTALSGCGPGFVFRFIDALAAAGTALGLPADQAARLAVATVEGSAMMAAASDVSPATLADRVASPGGSTREGLNVLDANDALATLLRDTLKAAAERNAVMAAAAR